MCVSAVDFTYISVINCLHCFFKRCSTTENNVSCYKNKVLVHVVVKQCRTFILVIVFCKS